jgi:hypothetical protein
LVASFVKPQLGGVVAPEPEPPPDPPPEPPLGGATPVPDNAMLVGEFVALLATLTLPLTAPAEVGMNKTVKLAV